MSSRAIQIGLLLCIGVAALSSCLSQIDAQMQRVNPQRWSTSNPVQVSFACSDTTALHDLWVVIRATSECSLYQLPLRITTIDPDGFRHQETIHLPLSDIHERVARTFELESLWRTDACFPKQGTYLIEIAPYNPTEPCQGVTAAGVRWSQKF